MELTKKYKEKLKNQKTCKVSLKVNYKTYLDMLEICESKNITLSQFIRQAISDSIKHPSYDLGDMFKGWFKNDRNKNNI